MAPIGKFSGVTKTGFSRVDNILTTNIAGIDNTNLVLALPPGTITNTYAFYNFENESTHNTTSNVWEPNPNILILGQDSAEPAWVNGPDTGDEVAGANGINMDTWGHPDSINDSIVGWNSNEGNTSSSPTGPAGGVQFTEDANGANIANSMYLYTETSSPYSSGTTRGPVFLTGFRFYFLMDALSLANVNASDDLILDFWYHALGDDIGDAHIYSRSTPYFNRNALVNDSSHSNCTLLGSLENQASNFSTSTSPYINVEYNLNHLKTNDQQGQVAHIIYFMYHNNNINNNGSGWHGDFAIDNVRITSRAT